MKFDSEGDSDSEDLQPLGYLAESLGRMVAKRTVFQAPPAKMLVSDDPEDPLHDNRSAIAPAYVPAWEHELRFVSLAVQHHVS